MVDLEKKQKVEVEEEDDKNSWTSFGSDSDAEMTPPSEWKGIGNPDKYDSDDDYITNQSVWDKYYQQVEESEGFDIEDYPGMSPMATICPLRYFLENPKNYDMLKGYVERALEVYNKDRGTNYAVVNVLKVNGGGSRYYDFYITFLVKTHDGEEALFQAKVVRDIGGALEFPVVRPKAAIHHIGGVVVVLLPITSRLGLLLMRGEGSLNVQEMGVIHVAIGNGMMIFFRIEP